MSAGEEQRDYGEPRGEGASPPDSEPSAAGGVDATRVRHVAGVAAHGWTIGLKADQAERRGE